MGTTNGYGGFCVFVLFCAIGDHGSPEAAALQELEEETGYKGDLAEWVDPGTTSGDDAESLSPKPKPGDREFLEVISSSRNDLLKRSDTPVAEEHPTRVASICSCVLAPNHANVKVFEVTFLQFEGQTKWPYVFVHETPRPPSLRLYSA
ncbi:unnamed protein product [Nyctereutes procyonoides]|uniref:(raccoon dog) hypothetical protein n=1 Tax=Nyctereutes procyonoides TaxID=34880 RepID=A0A811ZFQ2_NYCPR|nr:unnamed protein product [Nyctereutes procyonoides]